MAQYYRESNNENAKSLFYKRIMYNSYVYDLREESINRDHIVNFMVAEKALYGRVGIDYIPMAPQRGAVLLKPFKSDLQADRSNREALNFVVDAFNDMALEFQRCVLKGQLDDGDPYLSNLKVYKAYQALDREYKAHLDVYKGAILDKFKEDSDYVLDFDDFAKNIVPLLKNAGRVYPFTKPAFAKSRLCPMNISGLVVEIADLDYSNDAEKLSSFVSSRNWDFYINAANKYGFMIDFNAPWRLVADIKSTGMLEYARQYNRGSFAGIMSGYYENVHFDYYDNFKFDLLNIYNMVKREKIEPVHCGERTVLKSTSPTEYYSMIDFKRKYTDEYFLELYIDIRLSEEESSFSDSHKNKLLRDCLKFYRSRNRTPLALRQTLSVFETILNNPFDYRGSLSYIINKVAPVRKAAALEAIGVFDDESEALQEPATAGGGY